MVFSSKIYRLLERVEPGFNLTNSTIKNIVNSVIYRTKESSHDHYSQ